MEEDCLLLDTHLKKYGSESLIKTVKETRNERSKSWGGLETSLLGRGARSRQSESVMNFSIQEVYTAKKEISETLLGKRTFHVSWVLYIIIFTIIGGIVLHTLDGISFIDAW